MKDKYFTEWDENTPIAWWNAGRAKLNVVIRLVNDWTVDECPVDKSAKILKYIDMGQQTFGSIDGGSGWFDKLDEMKNYVIGRTENGRE